MSELCDDFKQEATDIKESLMELIAETDDELLEKYFIGEKLNEEDIKEV